MFDDTVADFTKLLTKESDEPPLIDVSELIQDRHKYKIDILRYYNGSPVIYEQNEFVVIVSNRNLTIINTSPTATHKNHAHVKIKTNSNGEVNLSTVKFIIDCCINHKYPHNSYYCWVSCVRLSIDEDYTNFLIRKRDKDKNKQKYYNAPNCTRR